MANIRYIDYDVIVLTYDDLSLKILSISPQELLAIEVLPDYTFQFVDMLDNQGTVVNKNMPRS